MHTHPLLTLALALPLAGALSLSSAPAQETSSPAAVPQPASDLSRFPAEQVEAVRDYIALLKDTERILADETMGDEASEQATLAALQALEARWEAVGKPLRRMSSRRRRDIMAALGFRADAADKELPRMSICIGLDGVGVDEYSATAMVAKQLHNNIRPPFNLPAEECAPALLQVLADLEAALQREGLTADEHAEALRYHRERLLYLAHPLYRIELWGEGYAREAGQMLRNTPGAVERIEAHLALMKAGGALESEAPTVVQEHGHYEHAVRDLFVHRMPGLTEEGRCELAELRAFIEEQPQLLSGESTIRTRGHTYYGTLELRQEARTSGRDTRLEFPLAGVEGMDADTFFELMHGGTCLLACDPAEVEKRGGMLCLTSPAEASALHLVKGGWRALDYLLEKCPELRAKIHNGQAQLKLYPPAQVEAIRAAVDLLCEVEAIAAGAKAEAEKIAAMEALHPRAAAVEQQLLHISEQRQRAILSALGYGEDLWSSMEKRIFIACGSKYDTPLNRAANRVQSALFPGLNDAPADPQETAKGLLDTVLGVERVLQDEQSTRDDCIEALRVGRWLLIYYTPIVFEQTATSDAYAQEVEAALRAMPEAAAQMERHLVEFAHDDEDVEDVDALRIAQQHYAEKLRECVLQRLPGLTEEGRQELAGIRAFLQEYPQVLLGELHSVDLDAPMPYLQTGWTGQYHSYELDLTTEAARDCFRALDKTHDLAFEGCYVMLAGELHKGQGGEGDKVSVHALRPTPGAYTAIHRVLAEQPELRERVLNLAEVDIEEGE